jgi:hypothetical protein
VFFAQVTSELAVFQPLHKSVILSEVFMAGSPPKKMKLARTNVEWVERYFRPKRSEVESLP